MVHLRRIFARLSSLFRNSKVERDLEREIAAHLTLLEDDFQSKGMSSEEARLAARLAYGGVEQAKQLHRDERSFLTLMRTAQDVRYTFRQLRKSPGFTATAVLILAFGIGATTAIFSIVEGVLLRPLPFDKPQRLVAISDALEGTDVGGKSGVGVSALDISAYTRDTHSFENVGGYQQTTYELSGVGEPAQVNASRFSSGVFLALGTQPLLGRVFTAQEDAQQEHVVVLSYSMWRGRLHGDPSVLGTKIYLDRIPYVVIGVMP